MSDEEFHNRMRRARASIETTMRYQRRVELRRTRTIANARPYAS